jgi:hypothetical protein
VADDTSLLEYGFERLEFDVADATDVTTINTISLNTYSPNNSAWARLRLSYCLIHTINQMLHQKVNP